MLHAFFIIKNMSKNNLETKLRLRYLLASLIILTAGLIINFEAPFLSRTFLNRTLIFEIPRKDFRLHVERVWKGDIIRLDLEIEGGDEDLYLFVERTHFYVGPRQEYGTPRTVLSTTYLGNDLIDGTDSFTFDIDLEGHLNIFMNNSISPMPKTVTYHRIFLRSTNLIYGTLIIRNLSILTSCIMFIIALIENYEFVKGTMKKPIEKN